ncbi:helix-turn-helix transcriptional regulator [Salinispora tropica]|uniref:Helix-turn-helix domain-containing protein n=1 Tax=Salinispora tropica (strain ATCC BAA-916 / DSM 44818 / JCM 13857 / NBRC 105044 / CNB-440) TaxID=369723 RepID=A4X2E0_SALTO|nr:helix-turn-helix domain-containing protein [Salinispora tropica]ABP53040.1 hypothetical protein Strop_0558 [Salinispora tropica CNB-440]
MENELLTVPEVLSTLKETSRRTFYRWRELGIAPECIKLPNGQLRVERRDLEAWIEQHREAA